MFDFSRALGVLLLIVSVLVSGGCAFLRGSAAGTAYVDDDMRHLRLPTNEEDSDRAVGYRSPYTYQEYDRDPTHGRAEALYMRARGHGTALDLAPKQLEAFTQRWVFNADDAELSWQQPRDTYVPGTGIRYRLYQHRETANATSTRDCVAFLNSWDRQSDDPLFRPGQGYFGYYCRPPDQALSEPDARDYLRRIATADPALPGFRLGQRVPRDAAALAQATGDQSAHWGITPFPFKRTRHYPIGGTYSGGQ